MTSSGVMNLNIKMKTDDRILQLATLSSPRVISGDGEDKETLLRIGSEFQVSQSWNTEVASTSNFHNANSEK